MNNIEALEQQYQRLSDDFQAGKLDEATFIAEIDTLQFQDDWGRYWMIGTQSGSWHYYDGQEWHQADPRDADKLPFMDDQGIYWQRGVKSGDWYYYQPDTEEWVKPSREDGIAPPTPRGGSQPPRETFPQAATPYQDQPAYQQASGPAPYIPNNPQPYMPSADSGPQAPAQTDGELFQDDEGRYWSVGSKTGQWYFFDHNGWHPAHEFQPTISAQPAQTQPYVQQHQPAPAYAAQPYQAAPAQAYAAQPYQPSGAQPIHYAAPPAQPAPAMAQPIQGYVVQPGQEVAPAPQPAPVAPQQPANYVTPQVVDQPPVQPQAEPAAAPPSQTEAAAAASPVAPPPNVDEAPNPPRNRSKSGSWYYFDGNQWLQYSTEEPTGESPPPAPEPTKAKEASTEAEKAEPKQAEDEVKIETQEEPVVAELFEDEPAPEVVDVEIVTVIEAEPEIDPYEEAPPVRTRESARRPAADYTPPSTARESAIGAEEEDIRPRRTSRTRPIKPTTERQAPPPAEPKRQPKKRTASDPGRPVAPRKRERAHEPTIIIPTETPAVNMAPPKAKRSPSKPVRVSQTQQRRARENTMPMEPVAVPPKVKTALPTSRQNRGGTQPKVAAVAPQPAVARGTRPDSKGVKAVPVTAAVKSDADKTDYSFGDVLRSFPSTIWAFIGGMAVLLIFGIAVVAIGIMQADDSGSGGLIAAAVEEATPTLVGNLGPNQTPTFVPTATSPPESFDTPDPEAYTVFSSEDLGFTLDYPDNWQLRETDMLAIFSPDANGLNPAELGGSAFWLSRSDDEEVAISDLLSDILTEFPSDAKTLNEGTISIASQTWTMAQIGFEDENLGGQGIATLAVTNKDEVGYTLVAVAPAPLWNSVQPVYQEMINSFRFGAEEIIAQADEDEADEESTASATRTPRSISEADEEADEEGDEGSSTSSGSSQTPTPKAKATPLVYVIKSGDTLLAIANQHGIDVDLLTDENGITNPNSLRLGQELTIPFTEEELEAWNEGRSASSGGSSSSGKTDGGTSAETEGEAAIGSDNSADESDEEAANQSAPVINDDVADEAATEAESLSGRIVYPAFNLGTNSYDLWMYNIDSGEDVVIAGDASQPAFNRDGSLLAYRSWDLGTRGIFFRDFVGGRGGQVTRFVEDGLPTWAPDGFSFAFASRREGDRVARLYRGDQQGQGDSALGFNAEYTSAFPDGRLVAKGCSPAGDCGIYVMNGDGLGGNKISPDTGDTAPAVSPDGSKIALMSTGRGSNNWEIWVINADGSNPQRLTENRSNEGLPAWSPDGKSIAYVSDQGGLWAVWVMNADGSNQRKLFNMSGSPDGIVLHAADNSKGWLEERISWAP